jgi:hypothetical protein
MIGLQIGDISKLVLLTDLVRESTHWKFSYDSHVQCAVSSAESQAQGIIGEAAL